MLDITMTATVRPVLIEETLRSFKENMLKDHDCRLVLNIDPVGLDGVYRKEIYITARKYFRKITPFFPKFPSFGAAFKRIWLEVETDFVFNLEDDWELLKKVDLNKILKIMRDEKDLMIMRLAAFPSNENTMKNWNKFYTWNGKYFVPPGEKGLLGFCGHPSIIKKKFIDFVAPKLDETKNPEKQIKGSNPLFRDFLEEHEYGVWNEKCQGNTDNYIPKMVQDLGRNWMIKNGFKKSGSKAFFMVWERS